MERRISQSSDRFVAEINCQVQGLRSACNPRQDPAGSSDTFFSWQRCTTNAKIIWISLTFWVGRSVVKDIEVERADNAMTDWRPAAPERDPADWLPQLDRK